MMVAHITGMQLLKVKCLKMKFLKMELSKSIISFIILYIIIILINDSGSLPNISTRMLPMRKSVTSSSGRRICNFPTFRKIFSVLLPQSDSHSHSPCELLPFASSSAGQYAGSSPDLALLGYSPLLSVLKSPQLR